jgi:hypothetical protein
MAVADQLSICSDALVLVGDEPITTFESDETRSVVAARRYPILVREHLAWNWGFNRRLARLARIHAPMPEGALFNSRYAMPVDMLLEIAPQVDGGQCEWEIIDGELHVDATVDQKVTLRYHGVSDERTWSPRFVSALQMFLAADFALSLREEENLSGYWLKRAETKIREARQADRTQEPGARIQMNRLQSVRQR